MAGKRPKLRRKRIRQRVITINGYEVGPIIPVEEADIIARWLRVSLEDIESTIAQLTRDKFKLVK